MDTKTETLADAAWRNLGEDRDAIRCMLAALSDVPLTGPVSVAIARAHLRLRDLCSLIGDGR